MDLRLLGPVELYVGDAFADVGPRQQRHVLAVLAAEVGRPVAIEALIDRVWDEAPNGARRTVQAHITRIRRLLAKTGGPGGELVGVLRRSGGYVLELDADEVDLHRYRHLADRVRAGTVDDAEVTKLLGAARGLWRGMPLTGLTGDWVTRSRQAWQQMHLDTTVAWAQAHLRLDNPGEVVTGLADLVDEHPFVESLVLELMRALHAAGRSAAALQHFAALRTRLVQDLGIEPGLELQQMHRAILRNDQDVRPRLTISAGHPARPCPAQLPAIVPWFSGRQQELAALTDALTSPDDTVAIAAVSGPGGMGKTWLAVRWAHLNLDRFPDGQLYVDLRGFDPTGVPMDPVTALRGFVDALQVDSRSVPADRDALSGLYRSLVAGRRMLIVLDNARDTAQVTALLPGSGTCTVLVTSRNQLTGLVNGHGARLVTVQPLGDADARRLLARRLSEGRLAAYDAAVAQVVAACGGLPLALGIAATRAAVLPDLGLDTIADELTDETTRLEALHDDHPQANLRAVLSWSEAALNPRESTAFLLLAIAPGPDIGLPAAAAVCGLPVQETTAVLRALERQSLVGQHRTGRWRMHDLVRLHSTERAARDLTDAERTAALQRVVDFYLHTAERGDHLLNPTRPALRLGRPVPGVSSHPLPDEATALTWFDLEHPHLLATQHLAAGYGWHRQGWQLAVAVDSVHRWRGHVLGHLDSLALGLAAAQQLGDPVAESWVRRLLGHAYARASRHADAIDELDRALTLAAAAGDAFVEALTERSLSRAYDLGGYEGPALEHALRALHLLRGIGDTTEEAEALNGVGWCHARLGNYRPALPYLQEALRLARRDNDRNCEAGVLDSIGFVAHHLGDHQEALTRYREALAIFRDLDFTYMEADVLECLGGCHAALGDRQSAEREWRHALRLYEGQHRAANADRVRRSLEKHAR